MKALITGASSGIGEAYARKFAELGYDLILTGRKEDQLNRISDELRMQHQVKVEPMIIELDNDEELDILVNKIKQTPDLKVLINNGGFGSPFHFLEVNFETHEKMVKVHVLAPIKLMYTALPGMVRAGNGIIINVSSVSANTPLPTGALYSATKSFLKVISESLYLENMDSDIVFQTLCPGFTKTNFHEKTGVYEGSFFKNHGLIRWMTPEKVVEISLKNLKKGNVICIPGVWNKVLWGLASLIPRRIYYWIVSRFENQNNKRLATVNS
jgi:uncharacterized protein